MKQKNIFSTLIFLWLSHFLVDFMIGIWPVYKTIAKLDIATMGIIAGISVFFGEILQLYFGSLSDRGYRKVLIISGLLITSLSGLISYTDHYLFLFLLFFSTCIGSGAFHPSAAGLLGSLSESRKGFLITIFATGGALGFSLSQLIFSKFYTNFNGVTVILMIPTLLLSLTLLMKNFNHPTVLVNEQKKSINLSSLLQFFKRKHLSCLYFTLVCNQIISWGTVFLLPDVLNSRGFDEWICFGGGHLFFILGGACMMVPCGFLADKFSYKPVIMTAFILGMIFFFTFLKFPFISNNLLLILLFLMGATITTINPLMIALGHRLYPNEPGAVSGFLMGFAWCFANPIGQAGGGLLTKLFHDDAAAKALSILGIFFFIGFIISLMLPSLEKYEVQEPVRT